MHDLNLNSIYYSKMLSHALGEVHGAVLTSGASEGDLKMVAAIALVLFDRLADKRLGRFKERLDGLREAGKEVSHGLATPCVAAQGFIPERIRHRPTVKHKATRALATASRLIRFARSANLIAYGDRRISIACRIVRQAPVVGK